MAFPSLQNGFFVHQTPDVNPWAPSQAILTDGLVRGGQRVGVGLTPAHGEDVHGFHVHDELRSGTLQTCGAIGPQVQTGVTDKDTEEEGKTERPRDRRLTIKLTVFDERYHTSERLNGERAGHSVQARVWKRDAGP